MKWTRAHWIGVLAAVALLGDSTLYVVLPTWGPWRLGLTGIEVGVLLSVNRFARILFNDPTARWIERRGLEEPLALAMFVTLVTTLSYPHLGFAAFLVMRILWGLAWSLLRNGANVAILAEDAARRGELQGSFRALSRIGSLVAVLVGSWLVAHMGFEMGFFVFAATIPVVLPFVSLERRASTPTSRRPDPVRPTEWVHEPPGSVARVSLAAFLVNAAATSLLLVTLGPRLERFGPNATFFRSSLDVVTVTGLAASGRWLAEIVVAPLAGRGVDRFGRTPLLVISALFAGGALGGCALAGTPELYVAAALMTFATLSVVQTALDALATDRARGSVALGRYFTAVDVGTAIGPLCAPVLVESIGFRHTYFGSAAVVAAVALAYMRGGSERRADHAGLHADG